jgi:hypothetical protein
VSPAYSSLRKIAEVPGEKTQNPQNRAKGVKTLTKSKKINEKNPEKNQCEITQYPK